MELVAPYGWHALDGSTLLSIREKLAHFETMTWSEILIKAKKRNHSIAVADLSPEAQQRLEDLGSAWTKSFRSACRAPSEFSDIW